VADADLDDILEAVRAAAFLGPLWVGYRGVALDVAQPT
jgi:hypothetical protein